MNTMKKLFMAACIALSVSSCGGNKDYLITIHTSFGDMKAILYDETPRHKANFIKLAKEGKYDSTIFHRVINNFMIQGGDINRHKPESERVEEYTIPAEFVPKYFHVRGALAAARQGDNVNPKKASSGSQFYIVDGTVYGSEDELRMDQSKLGAAINKLLQDSAHLDIKERLTAIYLDCRQKKDYTEYSAEIQRLVPLVKEEVTEDLYLDKQFSPERVEAYTTVGGAPHLDDEYTVFGRVVEGFDVIDKIAEVRTVGEQPAARVYMTIEMEQVPKKELAKKYGIEYR